MTRIASLSLLASTMLAAAPLHAQEVTLKWAGFTPEAHYVSENADRFFMQRVEELSGGEIAFEYYPGQQLGKATAIMDLALSGVADIGQIALSYVGDKLPVASGIMELPGLNQTSCAGTAAFAELSEEGEVLFEEEYMRNGLRPVFSIVLPPASVFTVDTPLEEASDFEGLKLRVEGGVKARTADALGAVPVVMSSPDTYQALSRGTIDALMFNYASVRPYQIETIAEYGTEDFGFGATTVTYGMSEERWQELSDEHKAILSEAAADTIRHFCQHVDNNDEAEKQKLEEAGMTIEPFSEETAEALRAKLDPLRAEWAKEMDDQGRAGSKVLERIQAELEEYDQEAWLAQAAD